MFPVRSYSGDLKGASSRFHNKNEHGETKAPRPPQRGQGDPGSPQRGPKDTAGYTEGGEVGPRTHKGGNPVGHRYPPKGAETTPGPQREAEGHMGGGRAPQETQRRTQDTASRRLGGPRIPKESPRRAQGPQRENKAGHRALKGNPRKAQGHHMETPGRHKAATGCLRPPPRPPRRFLTRVPRVRPRALVIGISGRTGQIGL